MRLLIKGDTMHSTMSSYPQLPAPVTAAFHAYLETRCIDLDTPMELTRRALLYALHVLAVLGDEHWLTPRYNVETTPAAIDVLVEAYGIDRDIAITVLGALAVVGYGLLVRHTPEGVGDAT